MIPTIEDIVKGLQDGSIGYAEAVAWLYQHTEFTDEKYQRYETFKAVALAHIAGWLANPEYASGYKQVLERSKEMTEQFLSSAQEFSVKEIE